MPDFLISLTRCLEYGRIGPIPLQHHYRTSSFAAMTGQDVHMEGRARSEICESTSISLVQRVKARDEEAWQRLLDLYVPLVYSWCRRSGMQTQDSADVVQDVFRAVSQGIAGFRHDRPGDTFRGWLRTIARNKIRNHFNRQGDRPVALGGTDAHQRFMSVAAEDSQSSTGPDPLGKLFRRGVELIRGEFEDRTWQAFWLATVEERTSAEIAKCLNMTPGAVRQAKYKVLRRLRQELGDLA